MPIAHGQSRTRLYKCWQGMKDRCHHKKKGYAKYGVSYFDEWKDFAPFYEWAMASGYQEDLTLDRVDAMGNYVPDNCRWISKSDQSRNRTNGLNWEKVKEIRSICHIYEHFDLAKKYNVCIGTIGLVANNKIWVDPDYVPIYRHRWSKTRFHIPRP